MSYSKFNRASKENYSLAEIERALKHKPHMYAYAESGDLDSIHLIVDSEIALKKAKPTEIQLRTMDLVWRQGLTLAEAGRILNVTPQAVKFNLDLLKVKLKKVVDDWKRLDREELSVCHS